MLLDSNIIIYASRPEHAFLRDFIEQHAPCVSGVSYVETLGYHRLHEQEKHFLEIFFEAADVLPLSERVLKQAVRLRQQRSMSLGDALIAGTALAYDLTLVTRNTDDFAWIEGLTLMNPFEAGTF
ncbi:MAG: type II toxin-antitoxin system VapC family toxin [Bacteroidetes bacterium]|nr:MAG: type II toxin-antitoxin system VapC family toxin [Bacteroidota bacterium]